MSVFDYKKYKISLRSDSNKTQGLQTGDIVRRQYFDGKNLIYSLMCVLDYGIDKIIDANDIKQQPYFIGALLEGDAPQQNELLDFARITNLFDTSRSGALYLTASDDQSPFMDVIDGIGRNASLCWPESIASTEYIDSSSQYIVEGLDAIAVDYIKSEGDSNRICHIVKNELASSSFIGIKQDFYQYVANPNRVLISYKIKASRELTAKATLGYVDDVRIDGEINVPATTDWSYKFHAITVDWSGRHLRSFKLDVNDSLVSGDEVWVADLNIILLSSVSNFKDSSQIRIGKMNGINDPVFGRLDGYGGYLQKLYASKSAHISGTLTAGDENGFAATFYAGKIHRNAFINSIDISFANEVAVDENIIHPTGVGKAYVSDDKIVTIAQTNEWLKQRLNKLYCFSFWLYAKQACKVSVLQNGHSIGIIDIPYAETHAWHRHHLTVKLFEPLNEDDDLLFEITPTFIIPETDGISEDESIIAKDELTKDDNIIYFTSPQLEAGDSVTQYQPTDDVLNFTEDYGAWFNRGGIGGTIQNPLLQLNYDGQGSIGTRTKSLLLKMDGSGYLANKNIQWDKTGKVTFGNDVTLNWENLGEDVKEELVSKSIKINGADTFTILGDMSGEDPTYSPLSIELTLIEENIESTSNQRQWFYLYNNEYVRLPNANGKTFTVLPNGSYWGKDNTLTIKCVVTINQKVYTDTITIRKQYIIGYSVEVSSEQGQSFKNSVCQTTLNANVYYQGKLVSPAYVAENFTFLWKKYHLPDLDNEVQGWWEEQVDEDGNIIQEFIDRTEPTIVLNYQITGRDLFICELQNGAMFPYSFPIIF